MHLLNELSLSRRSFTVKPYLIPIGTGVKVRMQEQQVRDVRVAHRRGNLETANGIPAVDAYPRVGHKQLVDTKNKPIGREQYLTNTKYRPMYSCIQLVPVDPIAEQC
jgi:hypothetical protein